MDREYISGVVKGGVSAPGAGVRDVPGKANAYPYLLIARDGNCSEARG